MKYEENEFFMLSAIQHYHFCPRQCALIHVEQIWQENELTALGRLMHKKTHEEKYEKRPGLIIARGLRLSSSQLGVSGQADVVEFHQADMDENSCHLHGYKGRWKVYPVEYKKGKPKRDASDEAQLCAQAICLEEMLKINIYDGAVFYGKNRRRHVVAFTEELRSITHKTAADIHAMLEARSTPKAEYSAKCSSCSLNERCLPDKTDDRARAGRYIRSRIGQFL